ncbi:TonB-dependent receptor [Tamlana sp. 2201CG12-4]|uniref:SusC/RagA family TonB-linked outer membrane protein n=1 Tax=Tamlana sp. 2201CG12-4 TaxID=3112582 RepID=UPI002DBEDAAB|nr:TonB-dependent receptor [Tamlana sp. 2201CG12-4]MEC3907165.1 TonB-dependent receptor [Tamlana sp. 2201CG12-4]
MKKILLIVLLLGFMPLVAFAQRDITGVVTDKEGIPLPGATVLVKGQAKGATTDFDGVYTLTAVKATDVLVYKYLGYTTKEIQVNENTTINVILESKNEELEQVVIVGYNEVKKKDLTGSVGQLKPSEIQVAPVSNFDQALAGRVTGVQVSSTDGTPGSVLQIVIRGGNSITGSNSPLYVVDGIPTEGFDAGSISTDDIESFDILKDASATAIYGSRGANGVILITTKGGRTDGKTEVRASASTAVQWIANRFDVLNPYEYVKWVQTVALTSDGYTRGVLTNRFNNSYVDPELYRHVEGTDWQDEIFRESHMTRYNFALSGGTKATNIYLSGEVLEQDGTLINTGFKKLSGNLRVRHRINDKTRIDTYLRYNTTKRTGLIVRGSSTTSIIRDAIRFRPVEPIISDGLPIGGVDPSNPNFLRNFNPVSSLNNTDRRNVAEVVRGSLSLFHKITPKLELKLNGSFQITNQQFSTFYGANTYQGRHTTNGINGSIYTQRIGYYTSSNTLTYRNTIKDHRFSLLGGAELQKRVFDGNGFRSIDIPFDLFGIDNLDIGTPVDPDTDTSANSLVSFFGRFDYAFKNKYLFTASIRADGSSKFNKDNRWGYFPSFSAGWIFSDEDFVKSLGVFSFGKIRAGWGETGNNRINDFAALSQLVVGKAYSYPFGQGENISLGAFQSNLGLSDLRWETTKQTDIGLDLGFLGQKVQLTADYYHKKTTDLLLNADFALSTGFSTVQRNVGAIENKGFELSLSTKNINKDNFSWTSNFNISFNRNKVLKLNGASPFIKSSVNFESTVAGTERIYITEVGSPVGLLYGLEFDGLYQLEDFNFDSETGGYILKEGIPSGGTGGASGPGSVKFVDQLTVDTDGDGIPDAGDGLINSEDRVVIGNPHPKHYGGFTNIFNIGNFDIQAHLQWSYDFDVLNGNRAVLEVPRSRDTFNGLRGLTNAWTKYNTDTTINTPLFNGNPAGPAQGNRIDNRYVEDGSYLKLRTVSIGYNLPTRVIEKLKLKKVRFNVTGQNLATWSDYSGLDPDVSTRTSALTPNLDYSAYPQSVTVSAGVDILF